MDYAKHFAERLNAVYADGLRRALRTREAPLVNCSSNDYLNLAGDPRLAAAAQHAIAEHGCGATASRLMAGHLPIHERLEQALADLVGHDAALVFPSGYQMNVAVVSTLFDDRWTVFSDALNHASLIDGCRLAGARVEVYPHGDLDALRARLEACAGPKAILTESVFSMDGDLAPLADLAGLARTHGALLVVDEAHALGIHRGGAGLCAAADVLPDVLLGTLGKAFGSAGGFVAGSALVRDLLINTARGFIFSTGLAPAAAAAALAAVQIVQNDPALGPELLARSRFLRDRLRNAGVDVPLDPSPIVPVVLGDNELTMTAAEALRDRGILVHGIRPPTVPAGTSRLRLSITLAHSFADLERLADAVADAVTARAAR